MTLVEPNVDLGDLVVGEKPAPVQYQFLDSNGAPIDLTGYTVKIIVRERDASVGNQFNGVLANAAAGIAQYTFTGAEYPTPGHYMAEFWAGNLTQRFASYIITFRVRASLGPVPNI